MEIRESGAGFEVIGAAYYEVFPTRFGALLAAFCLAARRAKFSGRTVEVHLTKIYRKTGVRTRFELVALLNRSP